MFGFVWRPTTARWEEPMSEPKPKDKPFAISKWVVWEAYQRVKANEVLPAWTANRSRSLSGT